jgi:hypothetical protein
VALFDAGGVGIYILHFGLRQLMCQQTHIKGCFIEILVKTNIPEYWGN